jgi:hypothetical protein
MTSENSLKEFEEMFDLSSKDEDNGQAEEYGHSANSEASFDELEGELSNDIKDVSDKGAALEVVENVHDIIRDVSSKTEEEQEADTVSPESEKSEEVDTDSIAGIVESMQGEDDFDCLPDQCIPEKNTEKEEVSEEVVDLAKNIADFHTEAKKDGKEEETSFDQVNVESDSMLDGDQVKWSLKSPAGMYDPFYRQKKRVLDSCLVGGQVEFTRWDKELQDAQVDVVSEVFDKEVITKQMEDVQQFRNRVKYIGVRVNNQHFLFDRFVPLLRGFLARIQYLKPVLKQDGLILEHMGDVEMYFERLRGLYKSVSDTEKNLAAAYEMLSRKVTICMDLPPVERHGKPEYKSYRSKFSENTINTEAAAASSEMDGFDDLPDNAKAGDSGNKNGTIGWDDI